MEDAANLETQLVESLNNIRTIKQFGIEQYTNVRTEQKFITLLNTIFKSSQNQLVLGNATELINRVFTILLLWSGSYTSRRQVSSIKNNDPVQVKDNFFSNLNLLSS
jgi:ATP-binding cassette subfamily B protein